MKIGFKLLVFGLLALTACKSKKNVVSATNIEVVSTKKIINNHYKNLFDEQTMNARLSAKFKDKRTSVSVNIKLRLEKDKTIWMSATKMGIPFAKVKITPTRVLYYEKLNRTFFDGDFSLLSKWLGTDLNYQKVQNLLLGQTLLDLKDGKYKSSIDNRTYKLTPKKAAELYAIFFYVNPQNFKVDKQEINHLHKKQQLLISYPEYQTIEGEEIPKKLAVLAIDKDNSNYLNIEYKSVEFNNALTFPFKIPNGYKEIELK